jgi:hypothetical protein
MILYGIQHTHCKFQLYLMPKVILVYKFTKLNQTYEYSFNIFILFYYYFKSSDTVYICCIPLKVSIYCIRNTGKLRNIQPLYLLRNFTLAIYKYACTIYSLNKKKQLAVVGIILYMMI